MNFLKFRIRFGTKFRRRADRLRDSRSWSHATVAYRLYLMTNPDDAAIWVQLGHCEKEQGRLAEAEACYRRAMPRIPQSADVYLQLGHVLKLRDRLDEAYDAYRRSYSLLATADAARELHRLRSPVDQPSLTIRGSGMVVFLIQDLFEFLQNHATLTGIQRVQIGVALDAMSDSTITAHFVINDGAFRDTFCRIDDQELRAIIDYVSGRSVNHAVLRGMLAQAELGSRRVRPGPGATLILLGAFWDPGVAIHKYIATKNNGVRIGAYVYDLIPISHPQYCENDLVEGFSIAMAELAHIADFVLTISDSSGVTLGDFLDRHGLPPLPMATVPLAHTFANTEPGAEAWPKALEGVRKGRFVAYVSTIEARKNHIYVVEAWRTLIDEGIDVPDLVFVGRLGWHIEPLMAVLRDTGHLGGRVHFAHGLSDAEVALVYRHAMFTVFTSFVEGWGLPVGESLAYGTPCVASSSSSIPEVAGGFVDYIDPENLSDGRQILRRMIEDDAYRQGRKSAIARSFVPRFWSDVAADFISKARHFSEAELPRRPLRIWLSEGPPLRLADLVPERIDLEAYLANPVRLLFSEHFADPGPSGAWMQGAGSRLKFATPCYAGDAVTLHMSVRAWPGFEGRMVSIRASGTAENQEGDTVRHALTLDESTIDVPARVGDEGMVVVTIEVDGSVPPRGNHDRRAFCLELVSIGYDPIDRSLPGRDDIEKSATQGMNAELGEHRAVVRKTL